MIRLPARFGVSTTPLGHWELETDINRKGILSQTLTPLFDTSKALKLFLLVTVYVKYLHGGKCVNTINQ